MDRLPLPAATSSGVDPAPLTAAHKVAAFAAERAPQLDVDDAFPDSEIALLHEEGLLAAPLPLAHGGRGLGPDLLFAVLRTIGYGSLPLGRLYEGHINALALITRFGGPASRRLAAEVKAGDLFGVWNTDDGDGLDLVEDDGAFELRGRKILCSGAGHVCRPLVTARTPAGKVMVVPRMRPGVGADLSTWRAHGMRASATGTVDFSGVRVRRDEVIGAAGDYLREPWFSAGAWRFAAVQLGGIERLVDELRRHLRRLGRHQDPHQQARVGSAAIAAETGRLWVQRACRLAEDGQADPERAVAYVGLARTVVERAGMEVLELTHRSVGLQGFMRAHPIERLSRDLATYLRQPAPDKVLAAGAAYALDAPGPVSGLW